METLRELFGDPISIYTREDMFSDGSLVDLMSIPETAEVAREHFVHPIACTRAAFAIITKAVENKRHMNDYAGIVHDMLYMSRRLGRKLDESSVLFSVIIRGAGRKQYYPFILSVGPGDHAEPVITIRCADESWN